MKEFFQQYATYLNSEDIEAIADIMRIMQEGENAREKKRNAEFLESCPYRIILAEFTEKEKTKFNIHDKDKYYRITDDKGNVLFGGALFSLSFSNEVEFLKKFVKAERYLVLSTYVVEEYSKDIVKSCKLKSALRYQMHNCVVDKERGEIVYVTENYISDYISVYKNILVDEKQRVWYLPINELLFTEGKFIAQTEKHVLWSNKKYWTANTEYIVVYSIDKASGDISEIE